MKPELSPEELAADKADKILVDIRKPEEWCQTGVIKGSHLLSFSDASPDRWMKALAKLASPADDLVLICRTGHRTGILIDFLRNETPYRSARHLADGILGWIGQGYPTVPVKKTL